MVGNKINEKKKEIASSEHLISQTQVLEKSMRGYVNGQLGEGFSYGCWRDETHEYHQVRIADGMALWDDKMQQLLRLANWEHYYISESKDGKPQVTFLARIQKK